jgi:F0F1-type ATP synthase assembly protein I
VREAAPLLGLGLTLAVTVLAGLGAGYWLDGRLGTRPWFLLLGACLGVTAALVYLARIAGSAKGRSDRKP